MKNTLLALALVLLMVAATIVVQTARFASKQIQASPAETIELNSRSAIERLSRAIRYQTISPMDLAPSSGAEFRRFHEFLRDSFPKLDKVLTREVVGDYSLLYTWKGSEGSKPILLMGHLDVVPVDQASERQWSYPPFSGHIADGYVWGRGALDDKASVMAILESAEALIKIGFQPRRTVYLAFGHDEEVGGRNGALRIAELLQSRNIELDYVLDEGGAILEGMIPGLPRPAALVGIGEKGYASLELSVEATGGHASMPPASTAIGILSQAIHRLENNPFPARFNGATRQLFEFIGPELPLATRTFLANLWLFGGLVERQLAGFPLTNAMIRTTIATTIFRSGIQENMLPTRARAVINVRLSPEDTLATVVDHARKTINDSRVKITPRDIAAEPLPVSDTRSASFNLLHRTIREINPGTIVAPGLLVGATDSRHYARLTPNIFRFQPLTLGADDIRRFHGIDERISIRNYEQCIRFYLQLIRNSAS